VKADFGRGGSDTGSPGDEEKDVGDESTKSDRDLAQRREQHRYNLASLLIGGFLIILGGDLWMGGYFDIATLAGIFSGWIVAIIGFYFMDQASDRTQQQAISITGKAERKVSGMADKASQSVEDLEKSVRDSRATIVTLAEERDKAVKLAGEFEKALKEALA